MKKLTAGKLRSGCPHQITTIGLAALLVLSALTLIAPYLSVAKDKKNRIEETSKATKGLPVHDVTEEDAILQALNRLGFGPRSGDLERVKEMGLQKWIDRQLRPDLIDDSALEARLGRFPTLKMASSKLLEEFPQPQVALRREGVSVEQNRKQQQARLQGATRASRADGDDSNRMSGQIQAKFENMDPDANSAMDTAKTKGEGGVGNQMSDYAATHTPQRIVAELSMAKVTRAVYSERQLEEEMVDFWFNHFNVFAAKGADRWLITSYERDAIRPHAMGKFRDLLEATAKSPAMLFFLDNWLSADPVAWARMREEQQQRQGLRLQRFGGPFGRRPLGGPQFPQGAQVPPNQNAKGKQQERGLNKNSGRELMELHNL